MRNYRRGILLVFILFRPVVIVNAYQVPPPPRRSYTRPSSISPHTGKAFGFSYRDYTVDVLINSIDENLNIHELHILVQQQEQRKATLLIITLYLNAGPGSRNLVVQRVMYAKLDGPAVLFVQNHGQFNVIKYDNDLVYTQINDARVNELFTLAEDMTFALNTGHTNLHNVVLGRQELLLDTVWPKEWCFTQNYPSSLEKYYQPKSAPK